MSDIRPEYKTPEIVTYRDSEILKQMGSLRGGPGGPSAPENLLKYDSEPDPGKRAIRYRSIFAREDE